MSPVSKDAEIRAIATELNDRLDALRGAVAELNALLLPPEADPAKETTP
jgi:hypothetical protein